MNVLLACVTVLCVTCVSGKSELKEVFRWKQVDFKFDNEADRKEAVASKEFIAEHNVPVGLEVWKDKIFVTVPRWKKGVPASLAYVNAKDTSESPLLIPYPNWAAHNLSASNPGRIISPFRVRADSCDRLWILDTGTDDVIGGGDVLSLPQVIVYNLLTDTLLRNFTLPAAQVTNTSFFANIAVDVVDCGRTYAYLGDLGGPGLVVYDWQKNASWKINNDVFAFDQKAVQYNVAGTAFNWTDGIFGLALTELDSATKERTLYFHAFSSFDEYKVSTKVLRSEALSLDPRSSTQFVKVGSRGLNTQSGASFVSEADGVLFYTQVNLDSVNCWNYRQPGLTYTPDTQVVVAVDPVKLVFPNDIKVDSAGNLWVLTDRMQEFVYSVLNTQQVNFRILTGPVKDLIKDTKCDASYDTSKITSRFGDGNGGSVGQQSVLLVLFAAMLNVVLQKL